MVTISSKWPVIDCRGLQVGELEVSVIPCDPEGVELNQVLLNYLVIYTCTQWLKFWLEKISYFPQNWRTEQKFAKICKKCLLISAKFLGISWAKISLLITRYHVNECIRKPHEPFLVIFHCEKQGLIPRCWTTFPGRRGGEMGGRSFNTSW